MTAPKVISRAGKAPGKQKIWVNVEHLSPENINEKIGHLDWQSFGVGETRTRGHSTQN